MTTHLPQDHPKLAPAKVGVLVSNLGTPDGTSYWPMRRYLNEFLSDRRVIDYSPWLWQPLLQAVILTTRPKKSGANYKLIWNTERDESPLLTITRDQTDALRVALHARYGDTVMVDFCMRYGKPSTLDKVAEMEAAGCHKIVFLPLYPQYAGATVATANDQFFRALMKLKWQPAVRTVAPYFDRPDYIAALAQSVRDTLAGDQPDILLCSYHGLPKRYLTEGDPYHCQCQKTTRLLREALGWDASRVMTTFQSKFGPEEWLQPYTVEEVARQAKAGNKKIAVISPAFSADCIETLEEIQGEIQHAFKDAGGESFTYIPCLNAAPAHVDMMVAILERELAGWL